MSDLFSTVAPMMRQSDVSLGGRHLQLAHHLLLGHSQLCSTGGAMWTSSDPSSVTIAPVRTQACQRAHASADSCSVVHAFETHPRASNLFCCVNLLEQPSATM